MKKLLTVIAVLAVMGLIAGGSSHAIACDKAKAAAECGKNCDCPKKAADEKAQAAKAPVAFDKAPAVGTKATCPVMGGEFEVKSDTPRSEYKGKHYVFCCSGCKPKFDADPGKYTK